MVCKKSIGTQLPLAAWCQTIGLPLNIQYKDEVQITALGGKENLNLGAFMTQSH